VPERRLAYHTLVSRSVPEGDGTVLLVRAGAALCALPVTAVVETLRPLPLLPLAGAPAEVLGVAVVRGSPVPVVDLALLVAGAPSASTARRWVMVRCGARAAALAVDGVTGIRRLPPGAATAPLLAVAAQGALAALRVRDAELLVVLEASRLVPEGTLEALERGTVP
jgi:purine-binding chemotaxis protein CheW